MQELSKQIKSVRRSEQKVLQNVQQLLVRVIEDLRTTPDLDGVTRLSTTPNCYTVSLKTIMEQKHGIDPDFYISNTQVAEIEKKIKNMTTLTELKKFLDEAIENKYIPCYIIGRQSKIALNSAVINKLIEIQNCF